MNLLDAIEKFFEAADKLPKIDPKTEERKMPGMNYNMNN